MKIIAARIRSLRYVLIILVLAGLSVILPSATAQRFAYQGASQQEPPKVPGAVSPASPAFEKKSVDRAQLPSARYQISFDVEDIAFRLGAFDISSASTGKPNQVASHREVALSSAHMGKFVANSDGSRIRVLAVTSPGAISLRVQFDEFDISEESEVYVYGTLPDSHIAGPYTGKGPFKDKEFWSDTIEGDTAIIEYYIRGEERAMQISRISHAFRDPARDDIEAAVLPCQNDASCFNDPERNGVGRIRFEEGSSGFVCTGTMLIDRARTFSPFFLTANHCVSSETVARTVETYWFYQTTSCNSAILRGDIFRSPTGASLLTTNQPSDSTLLRILNAVPGNLFFSGWDPAEKPTGTAVFGLHHPDGGLPSSLLSFLRRSSGQITSSSSSCSSTGLSNGYRITWGSGSTEAGSSGSGLWVSEGGNNFLVGVLSCGPAPTCSSTNFDSYGKFSDFYPFARAFIDPTPCQLSSISSGQTVTASLSAGDCQGRRGLSDKYTFTASAGQQISISLSSPSFDTFLSLLGPNGALVAEDDDGGAGVDSRIPPEAGTLTLPSSGTYTIEVSSFGGTSTGNYTLSLTGGCPGATTIFFGQPVTGALSAGDCQSRRGTTDRYTFTASAGPQIAISLSSSAFDTYLYLIGPSGTVLAENDDSGDSTNSRIPQTSGFFALPASGTYIIEVTSFSGSNIGSYTLSVVQQTACSYSISPTSQSFGSGGGTGSVAVTAQAGCNWSAVSNAGWITITSGSSGSGSGTLFYRAAQNSGGARSGTLTIAGSTFTVTQSGAGPSISSALVSGKQLLVSGSGFEVGAEIFMNGSRLKKVSNDQDSPTTLLVARKAGKSIARGQTVTLMVRNPNGVTSPDFGFTRP